MADRRRGMHNDEVQSGYGENQDRAGVPGRPSSQCHRSNPRLNVGTAVVSPCTTAHMKATLRCPIIASNPDASATRCRGFGPRTIGCKNPFAVLGMRILQIFFVDTAVVSFTISVEPEFAQKASSYSTPPHPKHFPTMMSQPPRRLITQADHGIEKERLVPFLKSFVAREYY
ncbi:hypothetical protein SCLCIDRAFT_170180 [Scleroderma citrinum Foug A]|uniref:Uncharacterized protein n=1 Tax=Scleroderma citrinum Foug A TaxID=1036808 RepID=A0A0C3EDQ9_9AGAM|nr:hypothetical protein SCLCIDRAFT_170180 [Scleroderma citrinum Foug A]